MWEKNEGTQSDPEFWNILQHSTGPHIQLVIVLICNQINIYACPASKWLIIC